MRSRISRISSTVVLMSALCAAHAQNSAGLTGVVTDSTGAVVRGAKVTLTNPSTGATFTDTTDGKGSYRFPTVLPAKDYVVTVELAGFSKFQATAITLQVGITHTENATLKAGENTTVSVNESASELTLNTTDFSIGNNFDPAELNELPIQNRTTITTLFTLQPGVTVQGSVTGARIDQSQITLDGMDVLDFLTATFATSTLSAPPDAIQEFRGTVAGQPAANVTGGGGVFQLVTKSGTNRFHGNLNEYHRDPSTQAFAWLNKNVIAPTPIAKAKQVQNQYGGNIGGPIVIPKLFNGRDRAFFFFNYGDNRTALTSIVTRTVPLDSYRAGIINYVNNSSTSCNSTSVTLYNNPGSSCVSQYTPAQVANLDPQKVGQDQALFTYIASRYPHANNPTGAGDGLNTGGYQFNQKYLNHFVNYIGRIDYNLTTKQHLFIRGTSYRTDGLSALNEFDSDPPLSYPAQTRSYGYVASHIWELGPNKVNQFYYGETVSVLLNPSLTFPTGLEGYGFSGLSGPSGSLTSQSRRVPLPTVRDDFNWNVGSHTLGFGGTFKFIKTHTSLMSDYPQVNVGLGGYLAALTPALRPTNINTNATLAANWDTTFTTDLGRIGSESRYYNYDAAGNALPAGTGGQRHTRSYQSEFYASDTWKVKPSLTLSYGLRYSFYTTPYEVDGKMTVPNLSFDDYFKARVAQTQAGTTGNNAVPFLTYTLGGKANNAPGIFNPSLKDLAPRIGFAFNPRSAPNTVINGGFALTFDRTVYNGLSYYQDQFAYFFSNTQYNYYGLGGAPAALLNDPRIGANLSAPAPPAGTTISRGTPYAPGVSAAGVPTGTTTNYTVDKNLTSPYNLTFNMGVQQKTKGNMIFSINYAGRLGRRLLAQADASQLLNFQDPQSGQSMSQAFAGLATDLRNNVAPANVTKQPWIENLVIGAPLGACSNKTCYVANTYAANSKYDDISDVVLGLQNNGYLAKNIGLASQFAGDIFETNKGYSAYHGLLANLTKNYSNGLQFRLNYTWAHSTDNVSAVATTIGLNTHAGMICDVTVRRACYGESDFDIKHTVTSDFVYQLPFGRGRMYGAKMNRYLDALVGGWSASGLPGWRSGIAYTATSSAYLAGDYMNAPAILIGDKGLLHHNFHKKANGSAVPVPVLYDDAVSGNVTSYGSAPSSIFRGPLGLEYGSRNNLRGPNAWTFDAGLAKRFQIVPDRVSFQFRGDAFNVLNHPTFAAPTQNNINAAFFGQITAVSTSARLLQVSGRLEF